MENITIGSTGDARLNSEVERQVFAAVCVLISAVGLLGNLSVIVCVALSRRLQTTTNVFVVNLAAADLLTCLFLPWQAVAALGDGRWPIPGAPWLCSAVPFVLVLTNCCSINTLALIAVNRWVGITRSRSVAARVYTALKLALMVGLAWGLPLCIAILPVITDIDSFVFRKQLSVCFWESRLFSIILTVSSFLVQFALVSVSYISIFRYVRKTSRMMTRANAPSISGREASGGDANCVLRRQLWRRQVAVTKNLAFVVLAFVVCTSPIFVGQGADARLRLWMFAVLFSNCCLNPVIYATSHPDFREAFHYLVRCRRIPRGGPGRRGAAHGIEINRGVEVQRPKQEEPALDNVGEVFPKTAVNLKIDV